MKRSQLEHIIRAACTIADDDELSPVGSSTLSSVAAGGERQGHDSTPPPESAGFTWSGEVSPQKWMNYYTKVMPTGGVAATKLEETRNALRELGLNEDIRVKER
jgi:hypothetical protein